MKKLSEHSCDTVNEFMIFKWLTGLLFAVCNGYSVTFEHPTSNCYDIYVHCTTSVYFILYDLLHILMSLWLHIVCTEILTCCKICTHKMATEICFFSQWLRSILTSHPMAFPSDNMILWQKVTVITDTKQIPSTICTILLSLQRDSSYILVCYWIKACEVAILFDIKWNIISPLHEDTPPRATAWDYHKCDRL